MRPEFVARRVHQARTPHGDHFRANLRLLPFSTEKHIFPIASGFVLLGSVARPNTMECPPRESRLNTTLPEDAPTPIVLFMNVSGPALSRNIRLVEQSSAEMFGTTGGLKPSLFRTVSVAQAARRAHMLNKTQSSVVVTCVATVGQTRSSQLGDRAKRTSCQSEYHGLYRITAHMWRT